MTTANNISVPYLILLITFHCLPNGGPASQGEIIDTMTQGSSAYDLLTPYLFRAREINWEWSSNVNNFRTAVSGGGDGVGAWNDPRWEMTPGSFYPSV